jgi:DNA-binding NarL/FixJ family response regulator
VAQLLLHQRSDRWSNATRPSGDAPFREADKRTMILLASPSISTLDRWESGLQGLAILRKTSDINSLRTCLPRLTADVLVLDLDLPGLSNPMAVASLRNSNPAIKIVVMTGPVSDETELALFKVGVRGCCQIDIDSQVLKRVVLAVRLGELWIRRSLTQRLLNELGVGSDDVTQTRSSIVGRLPYLTQREQQIAALVANGASNKLIARQLAITERTVKAHLTEIFRKLGVADRLKLALLLVGNFNAPSASRPHAENDGRLAVR